MKKYVLLVALLLSACSARSHRTVEEILNTPETPTERASRLEFTAWMENHEREYDLRHGNCTGRGCLIKGENCIAHDHARAQQYLDSHPSNHFE